VGRGARSLEKLENNFSKIFVLIFCLTWRGLRSVLPYVQKQISIEIQN